MKGLLFTALVAAGGAAAALAVPWVGVLAYAFLATLRPAEMWQTTIGWGFSDVVALGMVVGWSLQGFGNWRLHRATPSLVALVALLVWSAVCSVLAIDPSMAWPYVSNLAKIVLPVVIGLTLVQNMSQLRQLAWVQVIAYTYVSWVMNASYFFQNYNRAEIDGYTGGRASFAIGLVTLVSVSFFLAIGPAKRWQRVAAAACGILMLHTVLLTFSRGGLLGLFASGMVALWLVPKRPRVFAAIGVVALAGILLAGPRVWERFGTTFAESDERDASAQNRIGLWQNCLTLMVESPLFGVGPNNFPHLAVTRFGWAPAGRFGDRKEGHTLWLQTGAEMGIPGFVFLISYYGFVCWYLLPLARGRRGDPDENNLAQMVIVALAGFAVSAQFVSLEGLEPPYYVAMLGAGLLKLHGNRLAAGAADPAAAVPPAGGTALPPPVLLPPDGASATPWTMPPPRRPS